MMTLQELQKRYNAGERFEYNFFWGGYLSNWFESSFIVDNVYYWCTEQYMMAKKAELFGDFEIQEEIMKSLSQKEIKGLGRQIRNFNDDIWDKNKINWQIIFSQTNTLLKNNPYLGPKMSDRFDIDTPFRYLIVSKQLVFYNVNEENIEIIRILDSRQDYLSLLF